jgi:putative membrane protein
VEVNTVSQAVPRSSQPILAHPVTPEPGGVEQPPLSPVSLLTESEPLVWFAPALALAAAAYLYGVYRLRRRGDDWPLTRTLLFVVAGLGSIAAVTLTGLAAYESTLLSVHMSQHMVLSMVAPVFLALGAPVTLALRTLPRPARRGLLAVLHSAPVRLFTLPLVAFGIFVASPFALYFTDLYRLSLENALVHEWVHLHFLVSGCLFFFPLVGIDPLPGRWPHPGRVLLMVLMLPFHTVLGLTIMQSSAPIGGDWYASLRLDWISPVTDQQVAGGILWAGGEVVTVAVLAVLVAQWIRASEREARRIDRELDRAEAAQAAEAEARAPAVAQPQAPAVAQPQAPAVAQPEAVQTGRATEGERGSSVNATMSA